jgi:hypothetical protein
MEALFELDFKGSSADSRSSNEGRIHITLVISTTNFLAFFWDTTFLVVSGTEGAADLLAFARGTRKVLGPDTLEA